jgi:replicative DNA helicase
MSKRTVPVQDLDAERALVGALIGSSHRFGDVEHLRPDDFADESHRAVWQAMSSLYARHRDWDTVILRAHLGEMGRGDPAVLEAIRVAEESSLSSATITAHAEIVRARACRRRALEVSEKLAELAVDPEVADAEVNERMDELVRAALDAGAGPDEPVLWADALTEAWHEIQRLHEGGTAGVSTGLATVDASIQGLPLGETTVLAAKTGHGKTALAMQIAEAVAARGEAVLAFSLEMKRRSLAARRMAAAVQRSARQLADPEQFPDVALQLSDWLRTATSWQLLIDHRPGQTISEIRGKARRAKAKYPRLSLIVVDYLQLASGVRGQRYGNRQEEVTAVSRGLKNIASELGVAVLALSQFNRDLDREQRRPRLSDLRESGAVEQDAGLVLFLHRAEKPGAPPAARVPYELIVAKDRNGESSTYVPLWFHPAWTSFEEREEPPPRRRSAPHLAPHVRPRSCPPGRRTTTRDRRRGLRRHPRGLRTIDPRKAINFAAMATHVTTGLRQRQTASPPCAPPGARARRPSAIPRSTC